VVLLAVLLEEPQINVSEAAKTKAKIREKAQLGNTGTEIQKFLQPLTPCFSIAFDFAPVIGSTNDSTQGNEEDILE